MSVIFLINKSPDPDHLTRCVAACDELRRTGASPVLFSETDLPLDVLRQYPTKWIVPPLNQTTGSRDRRIQELIDYAELSSPAIVIEHTYPAHLTLPAHIQRVLIVQPLEFGELRKLQGQQGKTYHRFLLTDRPDSPTWPYTAAESAELLTWGRWRTIGPLPGSLSTAAVEIEQQNLSRLIPAFTGSERHLLVTLNRDSSLLGRTILRLATALKESGQEVKVISAGRTGTETFGSIPSVGGNETKNVEAWRSGFRGIMESAINDFDPHTILADAAWFREMPRYHLSTAFRKLILLADKPEASLMRELMRRDDIDFTFLLHDESGWATAFGKEIALALVAPHHFERAIIGKPEIAASTTGQPAEDAQSEMPAEMYFRLLEVLDKGNAEALSLNKGLGALSDLRGAKQLVLRVDQVIQLDEPLIWLLGLLQRLKLSASLEVVPYLSQINDNDLDRFDESATLFEVSQHGYAQMPRADGERPRGEFICWTDNPTYLEIDYLRNGFERMEKQFPRRFKRGFSPPYDSIPVWLSQIWKDLGGHYISCLGPRPPQARLPVMRLYTDFWNWQTQQPRSPGALLGEMMAHFASRGQAGLVIRPQQFAAPESRQHLEKLLETLLRAGVRASLLSSLAVRQADALRKSRAV